MTLNSTETFLMKVFNAFLVILFMGTIFTQNSTGLSNNIWHFLTIYSYWHPLFSSFSFCFSWYISLSIHPYIFDFPQCLSFLCHFLNNVLETTGPPELSSLLQAHRLGLFKGDFYSLQSYTLSMSKALLLCVFIKHTASTHVAPEQ